MPASLTTFDAALKDDYGVGLKKSINDKATVILAEATRNEEDIQGRQAVWSVHSDRSGSTGARAEAAVLPTPGNQGFIGPRDDLAYLYHTIKVTGQAARLTRGNEGSFARALETEIDRAERDLKNDVARQMFGKVVTIGGTRYTGAIGEVTAVTSGTQLTLGNMTAGEFRAFFKNMRIDVIDDGTGATNVSNQTITAVDKVNKRITMADTTGATAGDYVARQGSFGQEINGLRYLLSSTTYAGIDPSTNPSWQPVTVGDGTDYLSEDFLEQMHEAIETDGSGDSGELFITSYAQRRYLANQLQAQKRYDGRQVTLKAGWVGLDVARGTLAVDKYAPDDDVYLLTRSQLQWFVGQDWDWDDLDGKILYKALDDSDAVQARYLAYVNMEAPVRNAHAIGSLAVPS